jgi:ABC-type transport system involved in multi-copper enzyme maturation permease subunit
MSSSPQAEHIFPEDGPPNDPAEAQPTQPAPPPRPKPPRRPRPGFELPLLVKELNEQSAQFRTYLLRLAYGLLLLGTMLALFARGLIRSGGTSTLGQGQLVFDSLTTFQFWALNLFVPAVTCGCLSGEKERNTLGTLLITTLTPWQIVLQKFLGRFIPVVGYICLSFPMLAAAYSLGGLSAATLWSGGLLLIIAVAQTTSLSVLCSAYFATTVEALLAYFLLLFGSRLLLPFLWADATLGAVQRGEVTQAGAVFAAMVLLGLCLLPLWFAALLLERRAFVTPRNLLLDLFQKLDRMFNRWNSVTGGVVLVEDGDPLPNLEPVAWRETTKKSLGTFRYLFRVLLVLELPLVVIISMLGSGELQGGGQNVIVTNYLYGLWVLALLMTIIHGSSLIAGERTRQTLDVLLTIPLPGRELLLQKQQGLLRLLKVLLVPFATIFAFQAWWFNGFPYRWTYVVLAFLSVLVFLRLTSWVATYVGLRTKSQIRAVVTVALLLGCWLAVPVVVRRGWETVHSGRRPLPFLVDSLLTMHPIELVPELERGLRITRVPTPDRPTEEIPPNWWLLALSLALHVGAIVFVKRTCLAHADPLLGRLGPRPDSESSDEVPPNPVWAT